MAEVMFCLAWAIFSIVFILEMSASAPSFFG